MSSIDDVDRIDPADANRLRDRLAGMVAVRLAPVNAPPLESVTDVPPIVRRICAQTVRDFRITWPDGLPPKPHPVVRWFIREAVREFDEELARQYRLESPKHSEPTP